MYDAKCHPQVAISQVAHTDKGRAPISRVRVFECWSLELAWVCAKTLMLFQPVRWLGHFNGVKVSESTEKAVLLFFFLVNMQVANYKTELNV